MVAVALFCGCAQPNTPGVGGGGGVESVDFRSGSDLSSVCGDKICQGTSICTHWTGTCAATDNLTTFVQVVGVNSAAQSCNNYTLTVHYCSEGDRCGCP